MKLRKALAAMFFAAVMILSLPATASAAERKAPETPAVYSAGKDDIVGKWYLTDGSGTCRFYKNGKLKMTNKNTDETGKYTVKNGLLKMTFGGSTERCAALINDGMLEIKAIGDDKFTSFKSKLSADDYFASMGQEEMPLIFSKKKPVLAEHENILGTWVVTLRSVNSVKYSQELGLMVFSKDGVFLPGQGENKPLPGFVRKGQLIYGEASSNEDSSGDTLYVCGSKMYILDKDGSVVVFEPYKAQKLTKEALDAAIKNDTAVTYFKNGEYHAAKGNVTSSGLTDKNVTLKLDGEKIKFRYYCTSNCIYCINDNASVILERK